MNEPTSIENPDQYKQLVQILIKEQTWESLPYYTKKQFLSEHQFIKLLKDLCFKKQLSFPQSLKKHYSDVKNYYRDLLESSKKGRQLFPYHLTDLIQFTRKTPFSYYTEMVIDVLKEYLSYDSLPNFTANDIVRLLGVGRNQYIQLLESLKKKNNVIGSFFSNQRKKILKKLPKQPVSPSSDLLPWFLISKIPILEVDYSRISEKEKKCYNYIDKKGPIEAGILPCKIIHKLYSKGYIFVQVPIEKDDRIRFRSLQGFVINKEAIDEFDKLLYNTFITHDPRDRVFDTSKTLNVHWEDVKRAFSLYCRLSIATKVPQNQNHQNGGIGNKINNEIENKNNNQNQNEKENKINNNKESTNNNKTNENNSSKENNNSKEINNKIKEQLKLDLKKFPQKNLQILMIIEKKYLNFMKKQSKIHSSWINPLIERHHREKDFERKSQSQQQLQSQSQIQFQSKNILQKESDSNLTNQNKRQLENNGEGNKNDEDDQDSNNNNSASNDRTSNKSQTNTHNQIPISNSETRLQDLSLKQIKKDQSFEERSIDNNKKRIVLIFDETLTAFLLMGNWSSFQPLVITLFELGKMTDEKITDLLHELEQVSQRVVGDAKKNLNHVLGLKKTLQYLKSISIQTEPIDNNKNHLISKGDQNDIEKESNNNNNNNNTENTNENENENEKNRIHVSGVDMIKEQSLFLLKSKARDVLLKKNYHISISTIPLDREKRFLLSSSHTIHFGFPIPEATSPWMRLYLSTKLGIGLPTLYLKKGVRVKQIPKIFKGFQKVEILSGDRSLIFNTHTLLYQLNSMLINGPVLIQGIARKDSQYREIFVPLPLTSNYNSFETKKKIKNKKKRNFNLNNSDNNNNNNNNNNSSSSNSNNNNHNHNNLNENENKNFNMENNLRKEFSEEDYNETNINTHPLVKQLVKLLHLDTSIGYIKMIWIELEKDKGYWIPCDIQLGLPLFHPKMNFTIIETIKENNLFSQKKLKTHIKSMRNLSLDLLSFIAQYCQVGSPFNFVEDEKSKIDISGVFEKNQVTQNCNLQFLKGELSIINQIN
ncbi:protein fam91a1 [Anaeramoeba flamelloides]|uniref:Protein fam91a1 n=1 Tax=Anaeramoeba flamelloides TaxID=1746091 RepID=A0ABQ8YF58_9EUKA|nr:protein fam91a1 [Anaeramoeba flamelloides]